MKTIYRKVCDEGATVLVIDEENSFGCCSIDSLHGFSYCFFRGQKTEVRAFCKHCGRGWSQYLAIADVASQWYTENVKGKWLRYLGCEYETPIRFLEAKYIQHELPMRLIKGDIELQQK